MGFALAMLS